MSHANWLSNLYDNENFKNTVNFLSRKINQDKKWMDINCIVGMGISGVTFASVLSYKTKLPLVVIRKEDSKSHSGYKIEYDNVLDDMNYCVVDDLIDSGKTIKEIYNRLKEDNRNNKMKKIYLYAPLEKMSEYIMEDEIVIPVYSFRK